MAHPDATFGSVNFSQSKIGIICLLYKVILKTHANLSIVGAVAIKYNE